MPLEGTRAYTPNPVTPVPVTPTIRYRSDGPAPQALGGLGSLVTAATGFALQAKPGSTGLQLYPPLDLALSHGRIRRYVFARLPVP